MTGILPILIPWGISHIQYADDTIIMTDGSTSSTLTLKLILNCFEWLSGLKINYHKSKVYVFGIPERILMSPRGGVIRRICTLKKIFNPLSVLKPVRPVSKIGQTGFTQTEPTICKSPLRVLAQTKLDVGLPQGFPRVPTRSLHTAQAHQSRSKRKHKIYARMRDKSTNKIYMK
jgi:hypothetical protein